MNNEIRRMTAVMPEFIAKKLHEYSFTRHCSKKAVLIEALKEYFIKNESQSHATK